MPFPLLIPLIAAGSQLASQGINAAVQGSMNKKTRAFSREMYDRQRQDSLADWTMQNEYNSPQSQMARLKNAGLNPNLVYGNGATTPSVNVRGSDAPSWNPRAPQFDLSGAVGSGIATYQDMQIKQAQIDNLKAQNTVAVQDALLKAAQIISTTASAKSTQFDTELKTELKSTSMEAARAGVEKTKTDIAVTLDANERAQALQASSLQMAAENILTARANRETNAATRAQIYQQIRNLQKDERLKQLDINLKEVGLQPTDALWQRVLVQILNGGGSGALKTLGDFGDKFLKKINPFN